MSRLLRADGRDPTAGGVAVQERSTISRARGNTQTHSGIAVFDLPCENQLIGMRGKLLREHGAAEFADQCLKGKRDFPQKVPVAVEFVSAENIEKYTAYGRNE